MFEISSEDIKLFHIFSWYFPASRSSLGDCDVSKLKSLKLGCGLVLGHHPSGQTSKWKFWSGSFYWKAVGSNHRPRNCFEKIFLITYRGDEWPIPLAWQEKLSLKKLSSPTCCKVNEIVQVCWAMGGFVWQSCIFSSELQLGLHVTSDSQLERLGATLYQSFVPIPWNVGFSAGCKQLGQNVKSSIFSLYGHPTSMNLKSYRIFWKLQG